MLTGLYLEIVEKCSYGMESCGVIENSRIIVMNIVEESYAIESFIGWTRRRFRHVYISLREKATSNLNGNIFILKFTQWNPLLNQKYQRKNQRAQLEL
jgi:hypothetical protein